MKLFILTVGAAALAGQAAAFHGSLANTPYLYDPSGLHQELFVTDYLTGSQWAGRLDGGWDAFNGRQKCWVSLIEGGDDNYNLPFKSGGLTMVATILTLKATLMLIMDIAVVLCLVISQVEVMGG